MNYKAFRRGILLNGQIADLPLEEFVEIIADILAAADAAGEQHKTFQPGIGPFGEVPLVRLIRDALVASKDTRLDSARVARTPDLLLPNRWALEFKIARPFGDNGLPAEHWSENLLHPYSGNTSLLGDALKLRGSAFIEHLGLIAVGFEHTVAQVSLDRALEAFELIARKVLEIELGKRVETRRTLRHPVHQCLRLAAFEVFRTNS